MRGITIRDVDERGILAVSLASILEIIGERALHSRWVLSGVEAWGEEAASQLHRIADEHSSVDGEHLFDLAKGVWQIIDGKFEAFEPCQISPWLTVLAVDSSAYDVCTDDVMLLAKFRKCFHNVSDLPEWAF